MKIINGTEDLASAIGSFAIEALSNLSISTCPDRLVPFVALVSEISVV